MTRYQENVQRGVLPSVDDWNEHLVAFHASIPETMEPLQLLRGDDGRSSYEILSERVHLLVPEAQRVLDIGCGDGSLLAALSTAYGGSIDLNGIDLSPLEIARARERVPQAHLQCGDAMDLLPLDPQFDVAVSHLAVMALARPRGVLSKLHDAMNRDALLAVVVEDPPANISLRVFLDPALAHMRERYPSFSPAMPQSETLETDEGLATLLGECGFRDVTIERFDLSCRCDGERIWSIVGRTYIIGLLEPPVLEAVREIVLSAHRERADASGLVDLILPLRFVCARRL